MTKFSNPLKLLIACFAILLMQSCKHDEKTAKQNLADADLSALMQKAEHANSADKLSKIFKVDSSDFRITATGNNWSIRLEPKASFANQFNKISETIKLISKEKKLSALTQITMQPINDELLMDIAAIPDIQTELNKKSKNGIVNSMGIISPNAYQSGKLKKITDLFLKYNLEPYNYYIDKCRPVKNVQDTASFSMHCATISFGLKKLE